MGMRQYIYIGAYAECVPETKDKPIMSWRCSNPACPRHNFAPTRAKFCGDCGSPVEEYQSGVEKEPTVDRWELADQINEALTCFEWPGSHIWIANRKVEEGPVSIRVDDDDEINVRQVDLRRPAENVAYFMTGFKPALDKLREAYGPDNVVIKWGVVTYYL